MTPVDQQKLHDPPDVIGDCLKACTASVLEESVDAMPAIELWAEAYWWWMYLGWLLDWYDVVLVEYRNADNVPPGTHVIASGKSPRGDFEHAVVWRDGEIVHDPHPSRDGLAEAPKTFWHLTRARQ